VCVFAAMAVLCESSSVSGAVGRALGTWALLFSSGFTEILTQQMWMRHSQWRVPTGISRSHTHTHTHTHTYLHGFEVWKRIITDVSHQQCTEEYLSTKRSVIVLRVMKQAISNEHHVRSQGKISSYFKCNVWFNTSVVLFNWNH